MARHSRYLTRQSVILAARRQFIEPARITSAFRRTRWAALALIVTATGLGIVLQLLVPHADSVGDVFKTVGR